MSQAEADYVKYNGRRLMGSRIMELFSYWDQIKPDLQVANNSVTPKAYKLLIGLS
jgi:hypothetical protein